ncbi:MAG: hypothetical protein EBU23_05090 [Mycobacteriaceae bacterium]|nr:hypothetical protein [Mycobacterium sp.]NBP85121.1 hypothetical protein [Mycobacteriaceae bacterium]NBQ41933.1 hypothetical protein [Mycobacteriaceae bacterium]
MSKATELAELHHLVGSLRRCVMSLRSRYGDDPAMRRVVIDTERILSDVELLDMDATELEFSAHVVVPGGEKIPVPDTPYDHDFWRDIDDEGVGGHNRR